MLRRGDIALAFGVLTILVVLIMPLPSVVLDLFLAISITLVPLPVPMLNPRASRRAFGGRGSVAARNIARATSPT
jgi:hypothetical protein